MVCVLGRHRVLTVSNTQNSTSDCTAEKARPEKVRTVERRVIVDHGKGFFQ